MATLRPIHGIYYNSQKLNLNDVITPPYDVISDEYASILKKRSPYNFSHVILPKDSDPHYVLAKERVNKWLELDILKRHAKSAYYLYQQGFKVDNELHHRTTLLAAVQLAEFDKAIVRPHEQTYAKYKNDRLEILKTLQMNMSSIFAVVKDPKAELNPLFEKTLFQKPLLNATGDDDITHTLWAFDPSANLEVETFFKDKPLYIVDGHHRYGSALEYAKQTHTLGSDDPKAYMFFAIANVFDPALLVYPTHRVLKHIDLSLLNIEAIKQEYKVEEVDFEEIEHLTKEVPKQPSFGLYFKGKAFILEKLNWNSTFSEKLYGKASKHLSVVWTDKHFLPTFCQITEGNKRDHIEYVKDLNQLWEHRATAEASVILPAMSVTSITDVADNGEFMPQKSTYFYPKLGAGILLRELK